MNGGRLSKINKKNKQWISGTANFVMFPVWQGGIPWLQGIFEKNLCIL